MSSYVLIGAALGYLSLLFAVAFVGDRRSDQAWPTGLGQIIYALTLAVYCTSWTFYGAVGTAVRGGWQFLPIYLGPLLLLVFGWRILERLVLIGKERGVTSISDFIASRYGKSRTVAVLVTCMAICAALPYIALQLRSVTQTFELASGGSLSGSVDSALVVAVVLAVFAILFGVRHLDATEHHRGLMLAIAVESLVKLCALVAVALFAAHQLGQLDGGLYGQIRAVPELNERFFPADLPQGFLTQTGLAFLAILCLPRQFQVAVVECEDARHVRPARWLFGIYLLIVSVAVVPIAVAGWLSSAGNIAAADTFVLALPMASGADNLALVTFIGGFSAATAMVIVVCVALATMISNDIVMPALLRSRGSDAAQRHLSSLLLGVRRASIFIIALLGYLVHRMLPGGAGLADIGLLAFAAVAQFGPALLAGLYWPGASRRGAIVGLAVGFALCSYTLFLPALARAGIVPDEFLTQGPLGIAWLAPDSLFGLIGWDRLTHGVFWSLLANVACLVLFSIRHRPTLSERLEAEAFLQPARRAQVADVPTPVVEASVADLMSLAGRIMGDRYAQRAFAERAADLGMALDPHAHADRELLRFTERLIASAVGAASARTMMTSVLRGSGMHLAQALALLDEASQAIRFNRELLQSTLENIAQGISVVDAEMRLVAWNRRYLELFEYPPGMVYVGCPVADLIRYNARRGECGPGDVEVHVRKRLAFMRQGSPHVFERIRPDGSVIEMIGRPMAGGGFVTTFTDVTAYKQAELALTQAKATLEQRVEQRTHELREALDAQRLAKQEAEFANVSKTRFLAAASHDLLQPFNAARLFSSALRQQLDGQHGQAVGLVDRIDGSLQAAEELLGSFLDLARLDGGTLKPNVTEFAAADLTESLATWFGPLAASRGIRFSVAPIKVGLRSDRQLLRRILQNFLNNALRYTPSGRILLGGRRRNGCLEIQVCDTGPGIPEEHLARVFEEFQRGEHPIYTREKGLGLGLAICDRIARILGHEIGVRSRMGCGSVFWVRVPISASIAIPALPEAAIEVPTALAALRVLCIDNDRNILDGMQALLERWGCEVALASDGVNAEAAVAERTPDVILADFHLTREDGLALMLDLRDRIAPRPACVLITADHSEELRTRMQDLGLPMLRKPVKPGALRALLGAFAQRRAAA